MEPGARPRPMSHAMGCAVRVTGGTGSTFAPPEVLGANSATIHGTLSIPAGQTVERVDVFWDDEDEVRAYLGIATVAGNTWVLDRLDKQDPLPVRGRVVATTTVSPAENPETGIHKWEPDGPIDWNCDGVIGAGVRADLDKDGRNDDLLEARDDWATLRFDFYCGSPNNWDDLPRSPQPADQETYVPRSDLDPACPVGLLPVAGGGEVQLVIYGSSTFDVNRIETDTNTGERVITLSHATPPVATAIEDVDGDTWPDMVASFDASAIEVDPARGYMYWGSRLDAGGRDDPEVLGQVLFSAVPSPVDADGDGVDDRNGCDRCPSQTAPDPSADGCP